MKLVSRGNAISSSDFYKKKMRARLRLFFVFISTIILLAVALVFLLRLDKFQIKGVEISDASSRVSEMKEKVIDDISGHYFWLIPRTNSFLYPRGRIEDDLLEAFPQVKEVTVSLSGIDSLEVKVVERRPVALYCQSDPCYFLDESGLIFSLAPSFSDDVYFIFSDEKTGDHLRREFLPAEKFQEVRMFVAKLESLSLSPRSLGLGEVTSEILLPSGARIIFRHGGDLGILFSDLASFLESEEVRGDRNFWSNLQTLDLSTPGKVFYKFK